MCTPPFCEPARICLGCISLRTATAMTIVINAVYGLIMVVVHALLIGEIAQSATAGEGGREIYIGGENEHTSGRAYGTTSRKEGWLLQILDLDIAWAHNLLGFDDFSCIVGGMIYGIIIVCFCIFTLNTVLGPFTNVTVARWYAAFMHLEILIHIALMFCKFPVLCHLREMYLPLMDVNCSLLRFTFVERAVTLLLVASLLCWIVSSFVHLVSLGDPVVDNSTGAKGIWRSSGGGSSVGFWPWSPRSSSHALRHSYNFPYDFQPVRTSFSGVGDAVAVRSAHSNTAIAMMSDDSNRYSSSGASSVSWAPTESNSAGLPSSQSMQVRPIVRHPTQANQSFIRPPVAVH
eukprot:gnl/TRDRNA2_/TRDRNA2_147828_c0_seq4.p1 gnl/TRDRNA2_/TRDRNA2_147828_c0~~gnl/TRDRNA2_/TRDRNA2_147828_c0_seq4.p1  ORF type:complete len:347 (-),score=36.53 gnl/TRDRNA2_/TRDRNA2_147828_c0_seq4:100-1140(-)